MMKAKEEPEAIYLTMASKPYAPVKEWLHKACNIHNQTIKGMCWVNSNTLEIITTSTLATATRQNLRAAKPTTEPTSEHHRYNLLKSRTRNEIASNFYRTQIKHLIAQYPDLQKESGQLSTQTTDKQHSSPALGSQSHRDTDLEML